MASVPAILTGAGSGFLVAGPVGAAVGAGAGWLFGPRPAVEAVDTPAGPGVLVNDEPPPDPTVIPPSTQASAAIVNQLVNANPGIMAPNISLDTPLVSDVIDYQPYPPRYVWNQSDAMAGTWDDIKGDLPLMAMGVVSLGILALMYFSHPAPRR